MISFEDLVLSDDSPIYLQLIRHIKRGIVAGTIKTGEELPSRRVLSALLGVNPNTVQKAFRMLEEEGVIESRAGAKSYVAAGVERVNAIRAELIHEEVQRMVQALRQMGVSKQEALEQVDALWEKEEKA